MFRCDDRWQLIGVAAPAASRSGWTFLWIYNWLIAVANSIVRISNATASVNYQEWYTALSAFCAIVSHRMYLLHLFSLKREQKMSDFLVQDSSRKEREGGGSGDCVKGWSQIQMGAITAICRYAVINISPSEMRSKENSICLGLFCSTYRLTESVIFVAHFIWLRNANCKLRFANCIVVLDEWSTSLSPSSSPPLLVVSFALSALIFFLSLRGPISTLSERDGKSQCAK